MNPGRPSEFSGAPTALQRLATSAASWASIVVLRVVSTLSRLAAMSARLALWYACQQTTLAHAIKLQMLKMPCEKLTRLA
eukprot:14943286-Heterocapsa_arctica.AAC.1